MVVQRLMFICVHTSPLAPPGGRKTGGMNVYIRELAGELGQRGICVDIFTRRSQREEPDVDYSLAPNVRVIYLTVGPIQPLTPDEHYPYISEFTARLIAFTMRDNASSPYDLVYSHYWLSGMVAYRLKEAWGVPFVHMFHTLGQMKIRIGPDQPRSSLPDQRSNAEMQITQWADRIIAATPAEHAQLMWLYRARRKRIVVVPPGVNLSRFHPIQRSDALKQIGYDPRTKLLVFVGRIEPLKAIDTILEAIGLLQHEHGDVLDWMRLVIIGGNPADMTDDEMQRLHALAVELAIQDKVDFLGARDQEQLRVFYAAATAVLMPSDYESFGMVALEAMASGAPVIASQVGGLAFLVRNNETGFLVPSREPQSLATSILALVTEPHRSQEMGQAAALIARDYAWERIADRLLAVFESVRPARK